MPSRVSATAAALGTAALAATALVSVSAPATGAPTTAEWTCDQTNTTAPYTATVPTTISVRMIGGGKMVTVTSSAGTPTGQVAYNTTTPFTSSAWPATVTKDLNGNGYAVFGIGSRAYYGYDPTDESVWCASATTTKQ
ncbi:hypothetical protein GCM10022215_27790 [Nocardioides fonticola]|uniref:Ig-like domain-containing protein n=1 Tax=Nocardioides fonticola TaxID=450363 RepID=A0ABP7XNR5_9ACTN